MQVGIVERRVFGVVVAMLLVSVAAPLSAQLTGSVQGQVVDVTTQRPISGAQVYIPGSEVGTITNAEGRYMLRAVPAGEATVRVERLGYMPVSRAVRVTAGQATAADFDLREDAIRLDGVVVSITGEERVREMGNAVARIDATTIERAPIVNASDMLTGRAAGVQVMQSSGATGMGSRIRIRGANSVSLSNEPIIYVDGIRVSNDPNSMSLVTGGDAPSRLNDINPDEIQSIEVVKGPAAATLYGTDAANGVIWITTKRGRAGETRWSAYMEQGMLSDPGSYPASYRGLDAAGAPCRLFDVAAGRCAQARVASLNPLENPGMSPFRDGSLQMYGLNVRGGAEGFRYYLSGDLQREDGVLPTNALDRVNLRANFDSRLAEGLDVAVSTGYLSSELEIPMGGNYELGLIGNGLASAGTSDILGGWGFFPVEELLAVDSRQDVERFTGSMQATWAPLSFLNARATVGLDQVNRFDSQFFPTGEAPAWLGYDQGARFANRFQGSNYTADAVATADFDLSPAISSQTSFGVQYLRDVFTGTLATGRQLVAGSRSIAAAAVTESDEQTSESVTLGAFVQERFGFRDRLFITAALRADDNSAFGQEYDAIVFPKLSASWVVSEEPFFPRLPGLTSLRLRTAWGSAGRQPGPVDALRFFTPVPVTAGGESVTGVTFGGLGNPNLKPERSTELEAGFDAQMFEGRMGLEFTFYNKETSDALIFRELPPSLGVSRGRFENLGSVRNSGVEALLTARPVELARLSWEIGLNGSINDNEVVSLGEGIPPIIFAGGVQRHQAGYSAGGYWDYPILGFSDANGDGIVSPGEIQVGEEPVFLGTPFPTQQLSVRNDLLLFDLVRIGALFDFRGGMRLLNDTESWRNDQNVTRALNDPSTPLGEQARAVAAAFLNTEAGYIEDASFWKFRELSVTLSAPRDWARRFGSDQLSLVLAGRNLATWTDYTGIDPEVNQSGQANFSTREFMSQPPAQYWTARINVSF